MRLKRFVLFNDKESGFKGDESGEILLNIDHIISIKPIRIVTPSEIINGYWMRLSNGKKYRAIEVPAELKEHFKDLNINNYPEESEQIEDAEQAGKSLH